jgi:hypothetical protein
MPDDQILPCIGSRAEHSFVATQPPPGQWGSVTIFCTKCGRNKNEVRKK